jgi:hypothetical protein
MLSKKYEFSSLFVGILTALKTLNFKVKYLTNGIEFDLNILA